MLGALERKLAAIVADGMTGRPHLTVGQGRRMTPAAPGQGVVSVLVHALSPQPMFQPGRFADIAAARRRVQPVDFTARLLFRQRFDPAADAAAIGNERARLLDDMSLIAHLLGASEVGSGAAFAAATPDPGYRVRSFLLEGGSLEVEIQDTNSFAGTLDYHGAADLWPPGTAEDGGVIVAIDPVLVSVPLGLSVVPREVPPGGSARLRLQTPARMRLADPGTGARQPLALALRVISDLPPAERGTVTGGEPGAEPGLRLVSLAAAETEIAYAAPASGPAVEFIAVHLARPDGRAGPFLDAAAVTIGG